MTSAMLEVEDLRSYLFVRRGIVKAVDGVSFSLQAGESLGLMGESGCGKTMTCLSLLRLLPEPAGKIVGGRIMLHGEDLLTKTEAEMRSIRGQKISMILQDSMTSLNPAYCVGNQVGEVIELHQKARGAVLRDKIINALKLVRIPSAETFLGNFPHQLSGGMRQRVAGAIAMSCQPSLIIADEPTTALDVTIQAQYLRLLKQVQVESKVGMIFVTHDFGLAAKMCDKVAVMYAGKIVERAGVRELFASPRHPYTMGLLGCLPQLDGKACRLTTIEGQPPSLIDLPPGCRFAPRCSRAEKKCLEEAPPEVTVSEGHTVSCFQNN